MICGTGFKESRRAGLPESKHRSVPKTGFTTPDTETVAERFDLQRLPAFANQPRLGVASMMA
jgi:hypothetical protein